MSHSMIKFYSYVTATVLCVLATNASAQIADFRPVTDTTLANPDSGDWLMLSRTFDEQRFSPLNQINKGNVGQLRMAWSQLSQGASPVFGCFR
jgi:alcohol dehydrogenase (cytochrome c)